MADRLLSSQRINYQEDYISTLSLTQNIKLSNAAIFDFIIISLSTNTGRNSRPLFSATVRSSHTAVLSTCMGLVLIALKESPFCPLCPKSWPCVVSTSAAAGRARGRFLPTASRKAKISVCTSLYRAYFDDAALKVQVQEVHPVGQVDGRSCKSALHL